MAHVIFPIIIAISKRNQTGRGELEEK